MDPSKLPVDIRETFLKHEEHLRNKYVDMLDSLPLEELNPFDKNKYESMVIKEFKKLIPECDVSLIKSAARFISNKLNNDVRGVRGRRKIENKRRDSVRASEKQTETVTADSGNEMRAWDDETFIFPDTHAINTKDTNTTVVIDDDVSNHEDQLTNVKSTENESTEPKTIENTFWLCPKCRTMPQSIAAINTRLDQIARVNEDLVKQLASKIADIQELQSENARLRAHVPSNGRLNNGTNSEPKSDSPDVIIINEPDRAVKEKSFLLVGDSIIQDITPNNFDIDSKPVCDTTGKLTDITAYLINLNDSDPNQTYNKIIIHCGSNDAMDPEFSPESFQENYELLVNAASNMSDSVVISGLCPRLDDVFGNIHKANVCLKSISSEMSKEYIDNDPHFRNRNKTVNTSMFKRNNIHLSMQGSIGLANNLGITSKLTASKSNDDSVAPDMRRTRDKNESTRKQNNNNHRSDGPRSVPQQNTRINDVHSTKHKDNTSHSFSHRQRRANGQHRTRVYDSTDTAYNETEPRYMTSATNRSTDYTNETNDWQTVTYKRRSRDQYYNKERRQTDTKCWYCGESNHTSSVCRHGKELICRNCDGRGHKAKLCPHDSYDNYRY